MKLHKEGIKSLRNQLLILIILSCVSYTLENQAINILVIIMLFIFFMSLYFFRIPKRIFEKKKNIIYAPCDGKVVVIEETIESEFFNDKRIQISIFMSPLNIHNNLYAISGKVIYTKYHPGKFLFAWKPKASTDNERSTVVIKNNNISILCRQIAGALARRIVTYPKIGDKVNASEEIGFIKFGSRVDLFLPVGTKIDITLGEK